VLPNEDCYINDLRVRPFDIPHDSSQPVGYSVYADGYKMTVATDIGHVTDEVRENVHGSHILLLESNHDMEMLINGRYPRELKERVKGLKGHLSNVEAGRLLAEIAPGTLRHVYLGHLSEENNRPLIALDTVSSILAANNAGGFVLRVAQRGGLSEAVELE
jgi:phosphoribosyl 1,2-cyclic phosphodiesterase